MKVLVLNDSDAWMMKKRDTRGWTSHGLWFAESQDIIVVMDAIPESFIKHVANMKNIDPGTWKFVVIPTNRWEKRMFDGRALCAPDVVERVRELASADEVREIVSLWPTPSVAQFATLLGLEDRFTGIDFLRSSGYEIANSKASFRAFASGLGIPIPRGFVAHGPDEAIQWSQALFVDSNAIIAKRAHGGAGGANHLIHLESWMGDASISGAAGSSSLVNASLDAIEQFWARKWKWLSNDQTFPVIVEEYISGWDTFYAEFFLSAHGITEPSIGQLLFQDHGLVEELNPASPKHPHARDLLVQEGRRLANLYYEIGYRGYLSADAIIGSNGEVLFTEVNARFTGSTHLYEVMQRLPWTKEIGVRRVVLQTEFTTNSLETFLTTLEANGLLYDPESGSGTIALTPPLGHGEAGVSLLVNLIASNEPDLRAMTQQVRALA